MGLPAKNHGSRMCECMVGDEVVSGDEEEEGVSERVGLEVYMCM